MGLNLVKLCVGASSVEDLAAWQRSLLSGARGRQARITHTTYQTPKRRDDLLDGGSLYWVIKGLIQVRQRIIGLDEGAKEDGSPACLIVLDPELISVRATPRRAFQGWRYLDSEDAPRDLGRGEGQGLDALPPKMRRELAELFLI